MSNNKSPDSSMTQAEAEAIATGSDKSLTMHITGDNYSITYKGRDDTQELTLLEKIKMWGYMTDWVLARADDLTQNDTEDVRKYVLYTLVSKLTHECELQRTKDQPEESVIITP